MHSWLVAPGAARCRHSTMHAQHGAPQKQGDGSSLKKLRRCPAHLSAKWGKSPVVRGQLSRQLSRHGSLPGSSWLSLPVPEPSEIQQSPKKHISSSEPILDLKTDTAEALPARSDPGEPRRGQETRQDPPSPSGGYNAASPSTSSHSEPSPTPSMGESIPRDPGSGQDDASPADSAPWSEAPEECPARPNTLDFSKPPKKLEEVKETEQRCNSDHATVKENGVGGSPVAAGLSEERKALESELGKCIEDYRKIKIPLAFPNKKRQWQRELLRKYQL
ncbi:BTB/POZ domain-containing protein KCTD16-like [Cygnus olor]|uniref:BTB/POZ domain-containing protein KCTD16-like n=1 Tax=Cygnus olor TaxID=8869 RepID=UPI001ADE03E0|nr:BTB/POZ domain-containing protein KCTD16-like [Cygnus olor]